MSRSAMIFIRVVVVVMGLPITLAAIFHNKIREIYTLVIYDGTFKPDVIDHNFRTLHIQYPSVAIQRSGPVYDLPNAPLALPKTVAIDGQEVSIDEWLIRTKTNGFIIRGFKFEVQRLS